ncbi:MAG TPA: hypothetical protein VNA25_04715 [Phycisphaerae bacterium]|nr:hypothetical protein [Phycisphaerae bacterium]
MNELRTVAVNDELVTKTTDELVKELLECFEITAAKLGRAAKIVRQLDDRGYDFSSLRLVGINWLRRIAYNQMLPEVMEKFRSDSTLVDKIASLPLNEQARLVAEDGSVEMVCLADNGEFTVRKVAPGEMTKQEMRIAFCRGGIRTLAEQRGYIEDKRLRASMRSTEHLEDGVEINRKKKTITLHGTFRPSQLLSYCSQMGD